MNYKQLLIEAAKSVEKAAGTAGISLNDTVRMEIIGDILQLQAEKKLPAGTSLDTLLGVAFGIAKAVRAADRAEAKQHKGKKAEEPVAGGGAAPLPAQKPAERAAEPPTPTGKAVEGGAAGGQGEQLPDAYRFMTSKGGKCEKVTGIFHGRGAEKKAQRLALENGGKVYAATTVVALSGPQQAPEETLLEGGGYFVCNSQPQNRFSTWMNLYVENANKCSVAELKDKLKDV